MAPPRQAWDDCSALLAAELDPRAWEAATSAANVLDRVAEVRAEITVDSNFDAVWEGPVPDLVRLAQTACEKAIEALLEAEAGLAARARSR